MICGKNPYEKEVFLRATKGLLTEEGIYLTALCQTLYVVTGKNKILIKVVKKGEEKYEYPVLICVEETLSKTALSVQKTLSEIPNGGKRFHCLKESIKTAVTVDFSGEEKLCDKGILIRCGEEWTLEGKDIKEETVQKIFSVFVKMFTETVEICIEKVNARYDGKKYGCEEISEEELDDVFEKIPAPEKIILLNSWSEKLYIDWQRNGSFVATAETEIESPFIRAKWQAVLDKIGKTYDALRSEIVPTRTGRIFRVIHEKMNISFAVREGENSFRLQVKIPEVFLDGNAVHALLRQISDLYEGREVQFWNNPTNDNKCEEEFIFYGSEACMIPSHGKGCLEGCLRGEIPKTDLKTVRQAIARFLTIETGETCSFDEVFLSDRYIMANDEKFSEFGSGKKSGILCRYGQGKGTFISRKENYPIVLSFCFGEDRTEWTLQENSFYFCEKDKESHKDLLTRILLSLPSNGQVLQGKRQEEFFTTLIEKMTWENDEILLRYNGKDFSRKEVLQKAESLSYYLHQKIGAGKVVALRCERSEKMMIAIFAIILSGNIYLPVGCDYPSERVEYMLEKSDAKVCICGTEKNKTGIQNIFLDTFLFDNNRFVYTETKPEDIAYILFTSGSTGKPKGARISHRAICNRIRWMEKKYPIDGGRILQKTPYTFDVSLWELFWNVLYGGTLVILPPRMHSDIPALCSFMEREKITHVHFVPSVYDIFCEYAKGKEFSLRHLFLSGEKLETTLVKRHYRYFPSVPLHNLYGPTECAVDVTYYDCIGDEKEIPIGYPIDNCSVTIENGEILPPRCNGEIVIHGIPVGSGYVTGEVGGFSDGKYYTGDIGWYDEDGKIYFVGRKDGQIKINGQRMEISEIERVIEDASGKKSAVVVQPNGTIVAYMLGDINADIQERCRQFLPSYMVPSIFVSLKEFPFLENGKIDRKSLPQRNATTALPNGKREESVAKILIASDRNFDYFLGGRTSRDIIVFLQKIREAGYSLSLKDLFEGRTVERISSLLCKCGEKKGDYTFVPFTKEEYGAPTLTEEEFSAIRKKYGSSLERIYPVTPLQEGMMYHGLEQELFPEYITQRIVRIEEINQEMAKQAILLLGIRYDILRTAFVMFKSGSYQVLLKDRQPEICFSEGDAEEIAKADLIRGFDLADEPLFRFTVVGNKVVQTAHHIILDGWSEGVLWDAFMRYYHRLLSGEKYDVLQDEARRDSLTKPRFEEYVSFIRSKDKKIAKQYYQELLEDFSGAYTYPSEKKGIRVGRSAEMKGHFEKALVQKIKRYCQQNGVTVSVLTQAVWGILLAKANGCEDVVFGNVVSGRSGDIVGIEEMVGMFINTVPVRYKVKGSFRVFLADAMSQGAKSAENNFLALSDTGAEIGTITVFENFGKDENEFAVEKELDQSNYDLEFELSDEDTFRYVLYYNQNIYSEKEMISLLTHIRQIFEIILQNDTIDIGDIDILTEGEKKDFPLWRQIKEKQKRFFRKEEKPRGEREKQVGKAFCEVLSISDAYRDDDFFEIGGDSIKAIRLSANLKSNGYRVTVRQINECRTLSDIASVMERISDREKCYGVFEPSFEQKLFMRGEFGDMDSFLDVLCRISRNIFDKNLVQQTVRLLYNRHDMLRARVAGDKTVIRSPENSVELPCRTISLTGKEVLQDIKKECERERKKIIFSETGLFRALIFETEGDGYLYFCPHHYVCDSVSLEILATEFMEIYARLREGQEPVFPKAVTPYPVWTEAIKALDLTKEEREKWKEREEKILYFPRDDSSRSVTEKRITIPIQRLIACGKKFGADADCVLLTVLSNTLWKIYGCEKKIITKESHGRQPFSEDIDVSGTVGWFTSEFPVEVIGNGKYVQNLLHNKEEVFSIADGGIGYSLLANKRSDVVYNYVGEAEICEKDYTFERFPYRVENVGKELLDVEIGVKDGFPVLTLLSNGLSEEKRNNFLRKYEESLCEAIDEIEKTEKRYSPADFGMPGLLGKDYEDVLCAVPIDNLEEIAPLTFLQEGMLYHTITLPENREYVEQNITEFPFPFDKERIYQAVQLLAKRFGVLRTKYVLCKSGKFLQAVQKDGILPVAFCEGDYKEVAENEVKKGFDPFTDAPVRTIFLPSQKGFIFIWTYHHVSYDAWSDAKIVKSFVDFYKNPTWTSEWEQERKEEISFPSYARKIRHSDGEKLYTYWDGIVQGCQKTMLGRGKVGGKIAEIDRHLSCTEELKDFSVRKKISESSILEATAALTLKVVTGQDDVLFGKVVSGKSTDEKLTDSVGLFINTVPVRSIEQKVENILAEINRQDLVADKNGVCSYAEILRRNRLKDPIDFLFVNNAFTEERFPKQEDFSIIDIRDGTNYNVTFSIFDKDNYAVNISYYQGRFSKQEAEELVAVYEKCLQFILSGDGFVSDIRKSLGYDERKEVIFSEKDKTPRTQREREILSVCRTLFPELDFTMPFAQIGVSSIDRIRLAAKLESKGVNMRDISLADSVCEICRPTLQYFIPLTRKGNKKVVIGIPYAGASGRIYEKLAADTEDYDFYASVRSVFKEEEIFFVRDEVRRLEEQYEEVHYYAHCVGASLLMEILPEKLRGKIIIGGYIPDRITSLFGKPLNGWKRVSDEGILKSLSLAGLSIGEEEKVIEFFREDTELVSVLETKKREKFPFSCEVILADNDPFAQEIKTAKKRFEKLFEKVNVTIFSWQGHYFTDSEEFSTILKGKLEEK